MKISAEKRYAVLTGDVVGSSKLPKSQRQRLPELLKKAARQTRKAFPEAVPLDVDVFRGDGWQLLVDDFAHALRIALFFRAGVRSDSPRGRGLDTRVALAIGKIDFVPGSKVSEGDGEAYRWSGRALESLSKRRYLALLTAEEGAPADLAVVVRLIDALAQEWTGPQARAVLGALQGWTQERIAAAWPGKIQQPAVTKHLENAHWASLAEALDYVEKALSQLAPLNSSSRDNSRL